MFVLYSEEHNPTSKKYKSLPMFDVSGVRFDYYNVPDYWGVQRSYPAVVMRPATSGEETAELQHPVFSKCTVPVVVYSSYLYMYGQILTRVLPVFNAMLENGQMEGVTLVFATLGLRLKQFHYDLMSHLSNYSLTTLSHLSSRLPSSENDTYSQERTHVRCFETAHLCKFDNLIVPDQYGHPFWSSAQTVLRVLNSTIPPTPEDFLDPATFKVVFSLKSTGTVKVRSILNMPEIQAWCKDFVPGGRYNKTVCRAIAPSDVRASLAIYRAADVVVGIYGSVTTTALYMKKYSSVVELRPYQFDSWADQLLEAPLRLVDQDSIFWWGVSIKQPSNSLPGDMEKFRRGARIVWARDRHIKVNVTVLEHIFKQIVVVDRDVLKYRAFRNQSLNHVSDTLYPILPLAAANQETT